MKTELLLQALIFLGAAIICVPLAKKLGAGSVLGYLAAGVLIGPFGMKLVGEEGSDIMHASEFGVVMMLFLIGLELNPQSLWKMRKAVLGLGLVQMALTFLGLILVLVFIFRLPPVGGFVIAVSFAMSSTAIALQTMAERGMMKSRVGQSTFSVLLMQDIAFIPILALLPFLAVQWGAPSGANPGGSAPQALQIAASIGAIAALLLSGKRLVNPLLTLIVRTRMRELFTAASLALIIGVAYLMYLVGISPALGAFLAGVTLANSEFRHALESDIEPFKGLLLGLFFTAVGSTIDFHFIGANVGSVAAVVALVLVVKLGVLASIALRRSMAFDQGVLFAILLCQVGEFAFVVLSEAGRLKLLDDYLYDKAMAVAVLTMAASPLLLLLADKAILPRFAKSENRGQEMSDELMEERHPVIIAGFGHFGSTVGRFLRANGVEATILDGSGEQVDYLRRLGYRAFYGDCTKASVLKSAGADQAKVLICTISSEKDSRMVASVVQKDFPHLQLFIRTRDRGKTLGYLTKGVTRTYRQSLHTSVQMGVDVLRELGMRSHTAARRAQEFLRYDEAVLRRIAQEWSDDEASLVTENDEVALQERLLREDSKFTRLCEADNAWLGRPRGEAAKDSALTLEAASDVRADGEERGLP